MSRPVQSLSADVLTARYRPLEALSAHEIELLRVIEGRPKHVYRADSRVMSEGSEIRAPQFIISGWACQTRSLADGRRQVMGLLLPGDAIGLRTHPHPVAITTIIALSPLRIVDAPEVWRERSRMPAFTAALATAAAEEEHFMLCQIMRLGRQTAFERMSNLFAEVAYRLSARGMATSSPFPFPLTQEMLADVVGLSVVHVNRTLQQMRRENFIEFNRGRLAILDPDALCAAGEFNPPRVSAMRAATDSGTASSA